MKTVYWEQAQAEYLKRIKRYIPIRLVELKDLQGHSMDEGSAIRKEGEALLEASAEARVRIALTPSAKEYDSKEWSEFVDRQLETFTHMALLIGGPAGLSEDVVAACSQQVALSRMTFPHELARVVLLEQLYRAFSILGGEKYHK